MPSEREIPEGTIGHVGVFSILTDEPDKKIRRLPTLYVRTTPIFADREMQPIIERLEHSLEVMLSGDPYYAATACEFKGKKGLYAFDLYNRSGFRRKLARGGMTFSGSPYSRFSGSHFSTVGWGDFDPEFVILPQREGTEKDELIVRSGGFTSFYLMTLRFGGIQPPEMRALAASLQNVPALSTANASKLLSFL